MLGDEGSPRLASLAWRHGDLPDVVERVLALARLDCAAPPRPTRTGGGSPWPPCSPWCSRWPPTRPWWRWAPHLATACAGYVHFQFADYAKLTVVGVLIAARAGRS